MKRLISDAKVPHAREKCKRGEAVIFAQFDDLDCRPAEK
jgi:hypothetical protein